MHLAINHFVDVSLLIFLNIAVNNMKSWERTLPMFFMLQLGSNFVNLFSLWSRASGISTRQVAVEAHPEGFKVETGFGLGTYIAVAAAVCMIRASDVWGRPQATRLTRTRGQYAEA